MVSRETKKTFKNALIYGGVAVVLFSTIAYITWRATHGAFTAAQKPPPT